MDIKSTTHPAAAQTAARRWARIIGKGEYQATETGATGWAGGEKINSTPLLRGLNVSGHRGGQLRRIKCRPHAGPINVWSQVAGGDCAIRLSSNAQANAFAQFLLNGAGLAQVAHGGFATRRKRLALDQREAVYVYE